MKGEDLPANVRRHIGNKAAKEEWQREADDTIGQGFKLGKVGIN